jgi:hypothetical protein
LRVEEVSRVRAASAAASFSVRHLLGLERERGQLDLRRQRADRFVQVVEAFEGRRFNAEHVGRVGQILADIDFVDGSIERLADAIEQRIGPFAAGGRYHPLADGRRSHRRSGGRRQLKPRQLVRVDLVIAQVTGDAAVAYHEHAVAALEQFLVVRRGDDDRGTAGRRFAG